MWARKIGLGPLWPSRVKVVVIGILSWLTISQMARFLQSANVSFLDLGNFKQHDILCHEVVDDCKGVDSPLKCILNLTSASQVWKAGYHGFSTFDELFPRECTVYPTPCSDIHLAINFGQTDAGQLHSLKRRVNPFQIWGILFEVFASILIASVVFHDLVLLSKRNRPKVLSLLNMKQEFPLFWKAQQTMRISRPMHDVRKYHPKKYMALVVPHVLWQIAVFVVLVYPACIMWIVIHPMRMCRLGVFVSGLNMALWSLIFSGMVIWWFDSEHWAVFFDAKDAKEAWVSQSLDRSCVCHCEHPLKSETIWQLCTLALLTLLNSFGLTFRSLKGLRQARWACLFSVTYTVPIEVFPVMWERPAEVGGGPIQHRKEGEEVQGEPAFDAFALMDEQPESWRSTVRLRPKLQTRETAMQSYWNTHAKNSADREIRCCGFPKFYGIRHSAPSSGSFREELVRDPSDDPKVDEIFEDSEDASEDTSGDASEVSAEVPEPPTSNGSHLPETHVKVLEQTDSERLAGKATVLIEQPPRSSTIDESRVGG